QLVSLTAVATTTVFSYTYDSASVITNDNSANGGGISHSPIDPILVNPPTSVCVVIYHNTVGASGTSATGGHSNIGTGTGFNDDNSYSNNADAYAPVDCATFD